MGFHPLLTSPATLPLGPQLASCVLRAPRKVQVGLAGRALTSVRLHSDTRADSWALHEPSWVLHEPSWVLHDARRLLHDSRELCSGGQRAQSLLTQSAAKHGQVHHMAAACNARLDCTTSALLPRAALSTQAGRA